MAIPNLKAIRRAITVATRSPCRSQRGAVIFDGDVPIASGHNDQVAPLRCDGTDTCKRTCRQSAMHAEQAALLMAGSLARGRDMLHAKVVGGVLVPSGPPACAACSRLIVAAGIRFMWLFHEDGWTRYAAQEFHRLSVEAEAAAATSVQRELWGVVDQFERWAESERKALRQSATVASTCFLQGTQSSYDIAADAVRNVLKKHLPGFEP